MLWELDTIFKSHGLRLRAQWLAPMDHLHMPSYCPYHVNLDSCRTKQTHANLFGKHRWGLWNACIIVKSKFTIINILQTRMHIELETAVQATLTYAKGWNLERQLLLSSEQRAELAQVTRQATSPIYVVSVSESLEPLAQETFGIRWFPPRIDFRVQKKSEILISHQCRLHATCNDLTGCDSMLGVHAINRF